jgi:hypothetical protein
VNDNDYGLRRARAADAPAVAALVDAAYRHYVERIGFPPRPMPDDYVQVIREMQVTVAESRATMLGVIVLNSDEEGFVIDNVAQFGWRALQHEADCGGSMLRTLGAGLGARRGVQHEAGGGGSMLRTLGAGLGAQRGVQHEAGCGGSMLRTFLVGALGPYGDDSESSGAGSAGAGSGGSAMSSCPTSSPAPGR